MLGLLSFLALNENLNAIWLNAVGMSRYIQLNGSEGDSNTMAVTRPLLLDKGACVAWRNRQLNVIRCIFF